MLVDNFFSHRYDYRREWMRCIDTLTAPAAHTSLPVRAIRAVAEVVDSPAGVLFVRAPEEVAFQWAGSWNMPAATQPMPPGHGLIGAFRDGDWIVELDDVPAGRGMGARADAHLACRAAQPSGQPDRLRRACPLARPVQAGP